MPGKATPTWVTFEGFDTSKPVHERLPENCFEQIARAYLASGRGKIGTFGAAAATLLDGKDPVNFGVDWLERFFDE